MIQEGLKYLAAGMNPMDLKRGIDTAIETVVAELKNMAQPCATSQEIAHVAAISANNDRSIGDLVASAMDKVGREGAVSIEDGSGMASELEVVEGLQFDRGYLSAYFINNAERQSAVLEDVAILLYDQKLSALQELVPLAGGGGQGRPAAAGDRRGGGGRCAGHPGGQQHPRRHQDLRREGARLRRPAQGDAAGHGGAHRRPGDRGRGRAVAGEGRHRATWAGRAASRSTRTRTTIIGGAGDPSAIRDRVAMLKKEREGLTSEYDRKQIDDRIARLSGGVAVIKVGAATETELKERKLRVEDALHATRAAVEEGIVPGGGVALLRARKVLQGMTLPSLDQDSGLKIVVRALEEPLRRIVSNAAEEPSIVLHRVDESDQRSFGYNAATREYGDMLEMGVIDPAKVTRLALQNAGSIASLILTVDCMIANAPKKEAPAAPGMGEQPDMY